MFTVGTGLTSTCVTVLYRLCPGHQGFENPPPQVWMDVVLRRLALDQRLGRVHDYSSSIPQTADHCSVLRNGAQKEKRRRPSWQRRRFSQRKGCTWLLDHVHLPVAAWLPNRPIEASYCCMKEDHVSIANLAFSPFRGESVPTQRHCLSGLPNQSKPASSHINAVDDDMADSLVIWVRRFGQKAIRRDDGRKLYALLAELSRPGHQFTQRSPRVIVEVRTRFETHEL
jgi:hypothetical protein